MKNLKFIALSFVSGIFIVPSLTFAMSNLPISGVFPDTINLKTDCSNLSNCATTIVEIQTWIDTYKRPSTTTRLLVNVGPGIFKGGFICNGWSNLSFKGAGPDESVFAINIPGPAMEGRSCNQFNVQDMSFTKTGAADAIAPVSWNGTGSSTWTNVHIEPVFSYGWTEFNCPADPALAPVHRWFNSRIQGKIKGYTALCSKNWFFGSQIEAKPSSDITDPTFNAINVLGEPATARPEVHLYGSNISVILPTGMSVPPAGVIGFAGSIQGVNVISATNNATVHVHGTGIDIIGNDMPNVVAALAATTGGFIHADQAAFNLTTAPGGSVIRIFNQGGHVHSPYLWPGHDTPPAITSITGADTAFVTNTPDGHPHMIVYDSACGSKWYDTATKVCQ